MNARKVLHELVEKLPDSELVTAARILTALEQPADPLRLLLANAPADDELFDPRDLDETGGARLRHEEVVQRHGK
jgi:hypothetical protein